jgi:hypothetical protein
VEQSSEDYGFALPMLDRKGCNWILSGRGCGRGTVAQPNKSRSCPAELLLQQLGRARGGCSLCLIQRCHWAWIEAEGDVMGRT